MANQHKSQAFKLASKVIRHMDAMAAGHQVGGILLAGDPGVGKTTFVGILAQLLGMNAVVIEIPHISEEHLINIPFLVFNSSNGSTHQSATQVDTSGKMGMVLADSHLFSALESAKMMNDQEYLQHIQQAPAHVQQLYMQMGGSPTKIPPAVAKARQNHKTILFLDEYYRMTSMRIRNIMRGILNGNIGMHKIPKSVYIMYASNMRDPHAGLEEIPSNHQFNVVEYKTPSKEDWFDYLASQYQNHTHIKLKSAVFNEFRKLLKDEDISYEDVSAEVRTSPRRWEQLITYINTSIPCKSFDDARALLTNVKNNFINYQEETHSDLANKVVKATAELIKQTSPAVADFNENDTLMHDEWRSALGHAIEQIINSGGTRKHIPVVSGPPGIGKTSMAWQVAEQHNLRLIEIDVSELFSEDAIGMPLPGERTDNGKRIKVKFSAPKLYKQITSLIEQKDKAYLEQLIQQHGKDAPKYVEQYKKQPFKYLILLDELNRVDSKTFNSLRRIVLEKNFGGSDEETGEELKLPKSAIVIGAINPHGAGTETLTQHFRDVIDVIPAKGSWKDTKKFLLDKNFAGVKPETKDVAMNIMEEFVKKFKDKTGKHGLPQEAFYLDANGIEIYVSPREYSDMYATLVRELDAKLSELLDNPEIKEDQMRPEVDEAVGEALEDSLNMIFYKHQIEKDEFMDKLKHWVSALPKQLFGGLISKKAEGINSLSSTLEKYLDGHDLTKMPDDVHIVNANNTINHAQFMEEVKTALIDKIVDDQSVQKYIIDENHTKVAIKGEDIVAGTERASLLTNFFLSLLYTLHIHEYAHDRLSVVGRSLSTMMSDLRKKLIKEGKISQDMADDASTAAAQLRSDLLDVVDQL